MAQAIPRPRYAIRWPTERAGSAERGSSQVPTPRTGRHQLPFHQMGRYKWKELEIAYKLQNVEPPSREAIERAIAQFRSTGLNAS